MAAVELPQVLPVHEPLVANYAGHWSGALVFGAFLLLQFQPGRPQGLFVHRWSIVAAALAFLWNVSSLVVLFSWGEAGSAAETALFLGTAALSLLPAVLLHLCLPKGNRLFLALGYAVSCVAIALHASEMMSLTPHRRHELGLLVATGGFAALTAGWAARTLFRRPAHPDRSRRLLAAMALFLFSMGFLHLGSHQGHGVWLLELATHHAGIPLALFVLLQDQRFVLLDALVRTLVNFLLAAALVYAVVWVALRWGVLQLLGVHPGRTALLFGGAACGVVLYGLVRDRCQMRLLRWVFPTRDLSDALEQLRQLETGARDEETFLRECARIAADWAGSRSWGVVDCLERFSRDLNPAIPRFAEPGIPIQTENAEAFEILVPVRVRPGEYRCLALGQRRGGRRYLSDDWAALSRFASSVSECLEAARERQSRALVAEAELRALQSQIHPHFLFNTLNTLYGIIPLEARAARRTLLNLADILRYFLEPGRALIPLEEEIRVVEAYLEIESLRLGDRLRTELCIDPKARHVRIPVLSIQPLVENAVRHGIAPLSAGGKVTVSASIQNGQLEIQVQDTGRGFQAGKGHGTPGWGLGIENIRRRLHLCYGSAAELSVRSSDCGSAVGFRVPVAATLEENN